MPSQKQLQWAQLRVGVTVIAAACVLAVLIFLMSGTGSIFSSRKTFFTYTDNAGGLRTGAPVRVQGVDAGNVSEIRVVDHGSTPVRITMKIAESRSYFIHTDSMVKITNTGVLGDSFLDIDSTQAAGPVAADKATLPIQDVPDLMDVVRSSQSTLQNVNILIQRADRIFAAVETSKGSVGKLIYDKQLYNNLNQSVNQINSMIADVNAGHGSLGLFLKDEGLYHRANDAVDKLNKIVDDVNTGKGTVGKLIKDPTLYNNANQTIARANELMDTINKGQGALGKFAKDPEFARKLDAIVSDLSIITHGLRAGEGSAGRLLKDQSLYNHADQMLDESRQLVAAIRKDPKKYLSIKLHIF